MGKTYIDIDALRQALMDYYGTAAVVTGLTLPVMNLTEVESASPEELIRIAQHEHFDLSKFATEG